MFRVQQSPAFWAPVKVELTRAEGGSPVKFSFDVEFPRLDSDELKKFNDHIISNRVDDPDAATLLLSGNWRKVVYAEGSKELEEEIKPANWRGVVDENDNPLEVNAANIKRLLKTAGVGTCINRVFYDEIGRAAAKNS